MIIVRKVTSQRKVNVPRKEIQRVIEVRVMDRRTVMKGRVIQGIHPVRGLFRMITNHLDIQADSRYESLTKVYPN